MRFHLPRVLTPLRPTPAVVGHSGSTGCWQFHCPEAYLFLVGGVDEVMAGAVPYRVVPGLLRLAATSQRRGPGADARDAIRGS